MEAYTGRKFAQNYRGGKWWGQPPKASSLTLELMCYAAFRTQPWVMG